MKKTIEYVSNGHQEVRKISFDKIGVVQHHSTALSWISPKCM